MNSVKSRAFCLSPAESNGSEGGGGGGAWRTAGCKSVAVSVFKLSVRLCVRKRRALQTFPGLQPHITQDLSAASPLSDLIQYD